MENHDSYEVQEKNPVQQLQEKPGKDEFLIVGIGASAGGIKALQEFFRRVPEYSTAAYVVILHLSPDHDSQLAAVLQANTKIPVTQVTETVSVSPDHIYVVPPNRHLTMKNNFIVVSQNLLVEDRRAPVDLFFRTLADEHGPRSVAVILSGTGANGSMGLKRVKERGGACFVQNPREADFNEMPRNAIATELVDEVLLVADIPAKILSYKASISTIEIPEDAEKRSREQQQALREVLTQIRIRTGHDFSNYKTPILLRRIERRINIRSLPDLPAYANFLSEQPDEVIALLKDLLISVTNFYRDKKPFDVIEQEVIPLVFKNKTNEDQVRIWVAGCATGEEAYSIAMLCAEKTMSLIDAPKVQIFATDIDESAIAHAREGVYSLNDAADVSPERLRRFFNKKGDYFCISREIREMIMFAQHNFLKDPPFSHLDLLTCRNVMIYLNQVAQERAIETFHFALNPGGYLFLGTSESVVGATDLYAPYNRENHIFQSRRVASRAYPIPEPSPAFFYNKFKKDYTLRESENKIPKRISFGDLHHQLLEEYAPPSLIVNEEYDIVHLTERAGRYLQVGGGEFSLNLLKLVKPELSLEIRSALYKATQQQVAVEASRLKVSVDNKIEILNIHLRPVLRPGDIAKGYILVIFELIGEDFNSQEIRLSSEEPVAGQLEEELVRVKTQLRATNEQHYFQAEELKVSNEELQAMNEELRSSAEELETSKEELQSINEEMRTVNQELKVRIEETSVSGNNLQNLINSTDIGTIFLDRSFRVVLFTPASCNIFNFIPADHGRLLSDITNNLEYTNLLYNAEAVLDKLEVFEQEVATKNNRYYLMRIKPYCSRDEDYIKGVVITFVDITFRRQTEEAMRKSEQRLQRMVNVPRVGVLTFNYSGTILHANDAFLEILGYTREEFNARPFNWRDFTPPEHFDVSLAILEQLKQTGRGGPYEKEYFSKDGSKTWLMFVGADLGDGTIVEYAVDISERKKIEEALRISEAQLRALVEHLPGSAVFIVDKNERYQLAEGEALTNSGFTSKDFLGLTIKETSDSKVINEHEVNYRKALAGESFEHEHKINNRTYISRGAPLTNAKGEVYAVLAVSHDITERKKAEEQLKIFEERYRIALESAQMGTWDWNIKTDKVVWNEKLHALLGVKPDSEEELLNYFLQYIYHDDKEKIKAGLIKAVDAGGIYNEDFRIVRADNNQTRWMTGYGSTTERENNHATRMVGVLFDITERKKLEQQREDFLSIASHELKTPVTSIMAYGELLQENFELNKDKENTFLIQKMNAQINRLGSFIGDLLDTTKITEGGLMLNYESFDLTGLVKQLVEDLQQLSQKHKLTVLCKKMIKVDADKKRIEQVITNLISNAIKYSPDGGEVIVNCELFDKEVKMSVIDTGIGIPKELQKKVFDRFFRVEHERSRAFSGMGLGLYITAGIIRSHGGTINVRSNDDHGSEFYFTLPLK